MKHTPNIIIALAICLMMGSCKQVEEKDASAKAQPTTQQEEVSPQQTLKVLNANLATADQLKALKLNEAVMDIILSNRPFHSQVDLVKVLEGKFDESMAQRLFVPMNLNMTDEEDFKMIPGVGDKMAHEFEEYRPYISIKQFKKEMSKYVDEQEIERYLNYVFVPVELNTATEEDILALPGVGKKMAHEFEEYRPYANLDQFRREIGKYVDDTELKRLERLVYLQQ